MTDANYPHRLALVTAYAQAYRQASTQGPAAAASPARIAAQGFPRHPGPPAPAAPGQARQAGPPARAGAMTGPAKTSSSRKET